MSLYGVHFSGRKTGWAVGRRGTILTTTNRGRKWSLQPSGTSKTLNDVHFSGDSTGWAVGREGTILATTDGGSTWTLQPSQTSETLSGVHFSDDRTGWAVGHRGTILATTNGGSTWVKKVSRTTNNLYGVHFTADKTGWAVGREGTILATDDGGNTWTATTNGTSNILYDVHFSHDSKTGWAVGREGTILATDDGGSTWALQPSGTSRTLYAVHFSDSKTGWAVGDRGTILATTDGGIKWWRLSANTRTTLRHVSGSKSAKIAWAVGRAGTIIQISPPTDKSLDRYQKTAGDRGAVTLETYLSSGNKFLEEAKAAAIKPNETAHPVVSRMLTEASRMTADMEEVMKAKALTEESIRTLSLPFPFNTTAKSTSPSDSSSFRSVIDHNLIAKAPVYATQLIKSQENAETRKVLTTNLTRIGVIGFIVFFIALLFSLYRYKVRLAAFYDGRADILSIASTDNRHFTQLVDKFSPEMMQFVGIPLPGGACNCYSGAVCARLP